MQRNNFSPMQTSDDFQKAFDAFQSSANFDRLQEKFRVKPYFERNKLLNQVTRFSSYFLNVFSVATAFFCVFTFTAVILHPYIAAVFAVVGLATLEALKRLMVPGFFQRFFQFRQVAFGGLAVIVLLVALSVTLSYRGAADAILALTSKPDLVDVEAIRAGYAGRIADLEAQKADLKKTATWKGAYTTTGAASFTQYNERISDLEKQMAQEATEATQANAERLSEHLQGTGLKAEYFALAALIFDLLLLLALGFCEYYDFRSLAEFSKTKDDDDEPAVKERATVTKFSENGHHTEAPAQDAERPTVRGFTVQGGATSRNASRNALTNNVRSCEHCRTTFTQKTAWQRFCTENCRVEAWQKKTGKHLKKI